MLQSYAIVFKYGNYLLIIFKKTVRKKCSEATPCVGAASLVIVIAFVNVFVNASFADPLNTSKAL